LLASSVFMLQMITYMGIVLYAPALALSAVTSLPKWTSIIVVGLVCTLYCVTGGIKAVLWTDVFQSMLMFLCLTTLAIAGTTKVGGFSTVIQSSLDGGRLVMPSLSLDPTERHTLWSLMFGGVFIYLSLYGVNQTQVQRLMTVSTLKASQKSLWLSWPLTSIISLLTCYTGLVMYANFADCDPQLSGQITKRDQLIPLFMMELFQHRPGFSGIVIAGIFAGSLSTVSSFVNSLAAVTLHDMIRPAINQKRFDRNALIYTKILACFYGLLCLLVAYLAEQVSGLLEASLSIFSLVGGPLLALFTLGMCSRSCTSRAAFCSLLLSIALGFWMCIGAHFAGNYPTPLPQSVSGCDFTSSSILNHTVPERLFHNQTAFKAVRLVSSLYLYRISYMWVATITFFFSIGVGLSISFVFPDSKSNKDSNLFCSFAYLKDKSVKKQSVQLQDRLTSHQSNS
jgi:sodium-coupled monocarboxylate transporter 8/12